MDRQPTNDKRFLALVISCLAAFGSIQLLLELTPPSRAAEATIESDFTVHLRSRTFVPPEGVGSEALRAVEAESMKRVHVILQTRGRFGPSDRAALGALGVRLLDYVPYRAWLASLPGDRLAEIASLPFVRAIEGIHTSDKAEELRLDEAPLSDERERVRVLFHGDVKAPEAHEVAERHNATIREEFTGFQTMTIELLASRLPSLLEEDAVQWLEEDSEPVVLNDVNRLAVGAEVVQAAPYSLDGAGSMLGVWDDGIIMNSSGQLSHQDFLGRVVRGDSSEAFGTHATWVTGTAAGDGSLSTTIGGSPGQFRGMAPAATIVTHDFGSWSTEVPSSAASHLIDVANFSFTNTLSNGVYTSLSRIVDDHVLGTAGGRPLSSVWAAGNLNAGCDVMTPAAVGLMGGYDCILSTGQTAKNSITVGSVAYRPDAPGFTDSPVFNSARGPTDDGRIKPEIMAPGDGASGDLVLVPASASLDTRTQITLEAWVEPEPNATYLTAIIEYHLPTGTPSQPAGPRPGIGLFRVPGNAASLKVWTSNGSFYEVALPGGLPPYVWSHVIATYDGSVATIYSSAIHPTVASATWGPIDLLTSRNVGIAGSTEAGGGNAWRFNGLLDEVIIYDRALSAAEVADRLAGSAIPSGAVMVLHMDEGAGQTLADSSGHGNDGAFGYSTADPFDDPVWETNCQPGNGQCVRFSGMTAGGVVTTSLTDAYGQVTGTSFAAPTVAGGIALLLQEWSRLFTGAPLPSTVKALVVHSAADLENPGPDYRTGFGKLNLVEAADVLIQDAGQRVLVHESSIDALDSQEHSFTVPSGTTSLKATLAWDDLPATPMAALSLVNDLDLVLIDPVGGQHFPWLLDPANPSALAGTGLDHRNVVEKIEVASPLAGLWRAVVTGHDVQTGPQSFSLITPFATYGSLGCMETCSDSSHAFRWISVSPTGSMSKAEDLCAAIPNAVSVRQRFPESSGTYTYYCASQTCSSSSAETPNLCSSSCFCVDPGEGFDVASVGPSRFQIVGSDVPLTYTLMASESYLISVPFHSSLQTASDLADAIRASIPGASVEIARLDCGADALEVYRDLGGPLQGINFTLVSGEAVRILSTVGGTFTLVPSGAGQSPSCTCSDDDNDGYGTSAHSGCTGGAVVDCAPTNDQVWSKPGLVGNLGNLDRVLKHPTLGIVLSWSPPDDPGGNPAVLRYDTLRAETAGNFLAITPPNLCVPPSDSQTLTSSDPENPAQGKVWFYLVRAQNDCGEGPVGLDQFGSLRPARTCPCASDPCQAFAWSAEPDLGSAKFGATVASAGDVNGDGYDDVIVGAPEHTGLRGMAFVYHGSSSGVSAAPAWTAQPSSSGIRFGHSVASAGDVNGDGYDDVIVGAWAFTNGQTSEGKAYVYLGSATGLATTEAWGVEGNSFGVDFGFSVASAGDMNGDGYDDVIVGAPEVSNGNSLEGRVYVYLGSAGGVSTTPVWTYEGNSDNARVGESVAAAGDVNGDSYDDVIVGAHGYSNGQVNEGEALVFLGSATGPAPTPVWQVESNQASAFMGRWVASAGDVNGDSYDDLIVVASAYDNSLPNEGQAFVYLGSAAGPSTTVAWTFHPAQSNANLFAVAPAGDVNRDGYDDVIVGAHLFDNPQAEEGRVWVFAGSAAGLSSVPSFTAESDQTDAEFGYSAASAGDVNGDGYDDLIVGAHLFDNGETDEGRVYVYLGGR